MDLTALLSFFFFNRLSLDTTAMDSDGEREDDEERQDSISESSQQQQSHTCTAGGETGGPRLRAPCPRATVTRMVVKHQYYRSLKAKRLISSFIQSVALSSAPTEYLSLKKSKNTK